MILLPVFIVLFHDLIKRQSPLIQDRGQFLLHFLKDLILAETLGNDFDTLDVLRVFLGSEQVGCVALLALGF